MSGFQITSNQFNTSLQNIQSRYIKLELLNYQFQTVDNIEGVCTGGSISIDANSDIRRTGSVELVITDSSFEVASGGKVWLEIRLNIQ